MMIRLDSLTLRCRHMLTSTSLMRLSCLVLIGISSSCAGPGKMAPSAFEAPASASFPDSSPTTGATTAEGSHEIGQAPLTNAAFELPAEAQKYQVTLNSYQAGASSQQFTTPIDTQPATQRVRAVSYPMAPSAVATIRCQHGWGGATPCPHCPGGRPASIPPAGTCYPGSPCYPGGPTCNSDSNIYKDEYLCDGGNREPSNLREPPHVSGLETEDTLVQYNTIQGQQKIKYSNPVCVYAPRFSEVRSTSNIRQNVNIDKVSGAYDLAYGSNLKTKVEPGLEQRETKPSEADVRNRASGYEARVHEGYVGQRQAADRHTELLSPENELNFVHTSTDQSTTRALFLNSIQSAAYWTRDLYPQITASKAGGNELNSIFKAAGMDGVEINGKQGDLVIIKQADLQEAQVGEEITFTIQFRNTGTEPVSEVTIADNLTPRLGYIDGSQTSNIAADFAAEDNGEGSSVLTWILAEPLPGGAQGKITFKAVVR